ncbi:hypothetical protein [Rubrivivax gelatinosus]|uniref:hypothetical protein n=1 Tax=Rubrivivax gelatinosus TaxID=28068 RepID=UPI0005C1D11B|nr:hypothetical protein [Rubrivivax gelatinosus]
MKLSRKLAWLSLSVVVAAALVFQGFRNQQGYCRAQGRPLTDAEMVQAAVRHVAGDVGIDTEPSVVRAWVEAHPGCCEVDRSSLLTSSVWSRVIGEYWIWVTLTYDVRPEKAMGGLRRYRQSVEIGACGQRGDVFGEFIDPAK